MGHFHVLIWLMLWGIYHHSRLGQPPPPNAGLPASRGPSNFRAVRVCWCLSLPFSILFLFSLAIPLVITLELFTRLIHSSTVRHLSNTHWFDSRGAHSILLLFFLFFLVNIFIQDDMDTCTQHGRVTVVKVAS